MQVFFPGFAGRAQGEQLMQGFFPGFAGRAQGEQLLQVFFQDLLEELRMNI
jgi:hypothetical protein